MFFPSLNAFWNFSATLCLLLGYVWIKQGKKEAHKKAMIAALTCSAFFLAGYLYYHFNYDAQRFPDLGWIKKAYLLMLASHVILAVVMLPFIFATFYFAFKQNWQQHRRLAKLTFPIWLYVSFTGVLIYLLLYHLFAP